MTITERKDKRQDQVWQDTTMLGTFTRAFSGNLSLYCGYDCTERFPERPTMPMK